MRGKVQVLGQPIVVCMDHPRLCGEKFVQYVEDAKKVGSPPPMRGKGVKSCTGLCRQRDHPRLCGEKGPSLDKSKIITGSPPPMRGKGKNRRSGFPHTGITPAYAGKSDHETIYRDDCQDHPRLCGEKKFHNAYNSPLRGSPPPMRGKA